MLGRHVDAAGDSPIRIPVDRHGLDARGRVDRGRGDGPVDQDPRERRIGKRLRRHASAGDGIVGLDNVDLAVPVQIILDGLGRAIGARRGNRLVCEASIAVERLVVDSHGSGRGVGRRGRTNGITVRVVGKGHCCRSSGRPRRRRIGRFTVDRGAVRERLMDIVGRQVDRRDAGLRQGLYRLGPVGIGHHQLEVGKVRVAGVQLAIVIGIEHVEQGLHVGRGGRVPILERDLIGLRDRIGVVGIEEEHRVAGSRPGRAVLEAVAGRIDEDIRRGQLGNVDAVAREVENDRPVATGIASAAAIIRIVGIVVWIARVVGIRIVGASIPRVGIRGLTTRINCHRVLWICSLAGRRIVGRSSRVRPCIADRLIR